MSEDRCRCPSTQDTGLTRIRVSWCPIHGPELKVEERPKLRVVKPEPLREEHRVTNDLIGNTDARVWAAAWLETLAEHPQIATDEGTMLGWFANAIMAGYDEGRKVERKVGFDERVREIAGQSAGLGAGAVMQQAPTVEMPSEEIAIGLSGLLAEFGVADYPKS
jgi:hypothetical protein